jgi:hexosaminidase
MPRLRLLPKPRSVVETGSEVSLPKILSVAGVDADLVAAIFGAHGRAVDADSADVRCIIDRAASAHDEGYHLEIGGSPVIRITAPALSGLRWGLSTVKQIVMQCPRSVPALTIDDFPAFAVRGVMLDISRDRVPTMASLRDVIDTLAAWKINHLELYTEHTFAYRGHEDVWRCSSPITADEMRELDRRCRLRGIELTANQNCFGHFERWLKLPRYAHLGERSCGFLKFGSFYIEPNTLAASDPDGLALVKDLLGQLLPLCSGRYAHIGCDEPWDLDSGGRSQAAIASDGFHTVYAKHVSAVAEHARAHGKRPVYWSDEHHAKEEIAAQLPSDIVPVVWGYEPNTEFARRGRIFTARNLETWLSTSTNCWVSYTGRVHERRGNLARAAIDGLEIGATGILNTVWGDLGHRQQWPLTLAGIADGAQAQWCGNAEFDDEAVGLHAFASPALGRWLVEFGDVDLALRQSGSGIFTDSLIPFFDPGRPGEAAVWLAVDERLAHLEKNMPDAPAQFREECSHALGIARYAAQRAALRRCAPTLQQRNELAARLVLLLADHRRLWLQRSRYGGLEQSCDWYRKLIKDR